jgi:hypothetical protein
MWTSGRGLAVIFLKSPSLAPGTGQGFVPLNGLILIPKKPEKPESQSRAERMYSWLPIAPSKHRFVKPLTFWLFRLL